jgi:hypothetical protein
MRIQRNRYLAEAWFDLFMFIGLPLLGTLAMFLVFRFLA